MFALLLLGGCGFISDGWYDEHVQDADHDGVVSERFGGRDCDDADSATGDCDNDQDGHRSRAAGGGDCDDDNAAVFPGAQEACDGIDNDCDGLFDLEDPDLLSGRTAWVDVDGDGFGTGDPQIICDLPPGFAEQDGDCNDADERIFPGNEEEFCDTIDQDCDGETYDTNSIDAVASRLVDADFDLYPSDVAVEAGCVQPGFVDASDLQRLTDCDDHDPHSHPGAPEVPYDGIDQDCSGQDDEFDADRDGFDHTVDCDDLNADVYPGAQERCDGLDNDCNELIDEADPGILDASFTVWSDTDGDGFGDAGAATVSCGQPPPGLVSNSADCDDHAPDVHPGAIEHCDGLDEDCDGEVDEAAIDALERFRDADGDGYGSEPVLACLGTAGAVENDDDCDDTLASVHPGAFEICGDSIRQDCSDFSPDDCDQDGFEAGVDDCNDQVAAIHPGAVEICDGADNDCNMLIDAADPGVDLSTTTDFFLDEDADGEGGSVLALANTCSGPPGSVASSTDCDDSNPLAWTGAPERCDLTDDDCDGLIDNNPVIGVPTFWFDADGDGHGDPLRARTDSCSAPTHWVITDDDCNDDEPSAWSHAAERCDGIDNDCNGAIDDDDIGAELHVWYLDHDGDGTGQLNTTLRQCQPPIGYVATGGDCDDQDPLVVNDAQWWIDTDGDGYGQGPPVLACDAPPGFVGNALDCNDHNPQENPAALEICDGTDNDCDGTIDVDAVGATLVYPDLDGDGFGDATTPTLACSAASSFTTIGGDCADDDPTINPTAIEACDTIDNDCDGLIDAEDPEHVPSISYTDADLDGVGDINSPVPFCGQIGATEVLISGDCDDAEATTFPGAIETCDGADNDCDGLVDADDPDAPTNTIVFRDLDGDGFGDPSVSDLQTCSPQLGWSADADDCDDTDAATHPNATEVCDGVDNNCNLLADDEDNDGGDLPPFIPGSTAWFFDADGDGYGAPPTYWACVVPPDGVANAADCDDVDPDVHPGATEVCNSIDDDCDTLIDAADVVFKFADLDGDGFPGTTNPSPTDCTVVPAADCNDLDPSIAPFRPELCDGIDNNCNGLYDDDDPAVTPTPTYEDNDGDGFGDPALMHSTCLPLGSWVEDATDCNDADPSLFPGAFIQVLPTDNLGTVLGDACQQTTVTLAPGVHTATGTVQLQNDLHIQGSEGTVIRRHTGLNWLLYVDGSNLTLEDVVLDIDAPLTAALKVDGGSATLSNVEFRTFGSNANQVAIKLTSGSVYGTDIRFIDAADGGPPIDIGNGTVELHGVESVHGSTGIANFADVRGTLIITDAILHNIGTAPADFSLGNGNTLYLERTTLSRTRGINGILSSVELYGVEFQIDPLGNSSALEMDTSTVTGSNLLFVGATSQPVLVLVDSTLDLDQVTDATTIEALVDTVNTTGQITNLVIGFERQDASADLGLGWDQIDCNNCTVPIGVTLPNGAPHQNADVAFMSLATCMSDPSAMHAALQPAFLNITNSSNFAGHLGGPLGEPDYYLDTDLDGLPDGWERFFFGALETTSGDANTDGDALSQVQEINAGTSPLHTRTDGTNVDPLLCPSP